MWHNTPWQPSGAASLYPGTIVTEIDESKGGARDALMAVEKVSREQIAKSLTIGASQLALAYRIILPQIMPRLIESMRLSLGSTWLFLPATRGHCPGTHHTAMHPAHG